MGHFQTNIHDGDSDTNTLMNLFMNCNLIKKSKVFDAIGKPLFGRFDPVVECHLSPSQLLILRLVHILGRQWRKCLGGFCWFWGMKQQMEVLSLFLSLFAFQIYIYF